LGEWGLHLLGKLPRLKLDLQKPIYERNYAFLLWFSSVAFTDPGLALAVNGIRNREAGEG